MLRDELRIHRDAVAVRQTVCLVGEPDDREQLGELGIAHALGTRSRGVGVNTVLAVVRDAHCDIDHLLHERIKGAWGHHLLHVLPDALQCRRMARKHLPEVVHPIDLARCHDVIEYGTSLGRSLLVLEHLDHRHERSSFGLTAASMATVYPAAAPGAIERALPRGSLRRRGDLRGARPPARFRVEGSAWPSRSARLLPLLRSASSPSLALLHRRPRRLRPQPPRRRAPRRPPPQPRPPPRRPSARSLRASSPNTCA